MSFLPEQLFFVCASFISVLLWLTLYYHICAIDIWADDWFCNSRWLIFPFTVRTYSSYFVTDPFCWSIQFIWQHLVLLQPMLSLNVYRKEFLLHMTSHTCTWFLFWLYLLLSLNYWYGPKFVHIFTTISYFYEHIYFSLRWSIREINIVCLENLLCF
jgi:hypothetical protein